MAHRADLWPHALNSKPHAFRCLSELLKHPRGRNLLQEHRHFGPLLTGLQDKSQQLCQQLVVNLKSGQPTVVDQALNERGGKTNKGKGNKAAHGACIPAASILPAALDAAPQLIQVMCRAAMHMSLMSILVQDEEQGEASSRQECLELAASVLMHAQDLAEQVRLQSALSSCTPCCKTWCLE